MKLLVSFTALMLFLLPVAWAQQVEIQIPNEPSVGIIEGIVNITWILLKSSMYLILILLAMPCPMGLLAFFGAVLSSIWNCSSRPFQEVIDSLYSVFKSAQETSPLHPLLDLLIFTIPLGVLLPLLLICSLFERVVSFFKPEITVSPEILTQGEDWTELLEQGIEWLGRIFDLVLPFLAFVV